MMDILMSETCWAHKKYNKIASDIKLVFYSSTSKFFSTTRCVIFTLFILFYITFSIYSDTLDYSQEDYKTVCNVIIPPFVIIVTTDL